VNLIRLTKNHAADLSTINILNTLELVDIYPVLLNSGVLVNSLSRHLLASFTTLLDSVI
jgi:hypothetical protein